MNKGNMEWGGRMLDDIRDAISHVIEQGTVDPDRIGLMGTSYGGYAALMLCSRYPDDYRCAIDLFGPTNLVKLIESIPPQWQSQKEMFHQRVGNPETDAGRTALLAQSPLSHTDNINTPLLIAEGIHDPRVDHHNIGEYVEKLKQRNNLPVTHISFPDEGHNLSRLENRITFFAIAELFLQQHLQGNSEPLDPKLLEKVNFLYGKDFIFNK